MSLEQGTPTCFPPNADSLTRRLEKLEKKQEVKGKTLRSEDGSRNHLNNLAGEQTGQSDSTRGKLHDGNQECLSYAQSNEKTASHEFDSQNVQIFSSSSDSENQRRGTSRPLNIRDFQAGRLPFQIEARKKEEQKINRNVQEMWERRGAELLEDKDNWKYNLEDILGDSDAEKNLSRSQNIVKDTNILPEGIASDVTHYDNLVQGLAAPRAKCVICRRKHKSGCIGLFCSDCTQEKFLNNAAPTEVASQRFRSHIPIKPRRNQLNRKSSADLVEAASKNRRKFSHQQIRLFTDSDEDENDNPQKTTKRKTKRRRISKKERKDISSDQSEDSDLPELTQDGFDVRVKVRQTNHTWKANISFNGKNNFSTSGITKAQPSLTEELRGGMYSTTNTAKSCLSGYSKYLIAMGIVSLCCFISGLLVGVCFHNLRDSFASSLTW